jgi:hypothetical protein
MPMLVAQNKYRTANPGSNSLLQVKKLLGWACFVSNFVCLLNGHAATVEPSAQQVKPRNKKDDFSRSHVTKMMLQFS